MQSLWFSRVGGLLPHRKPIRPEIDRRGPDRAWLRAAFTFLFLEGAFAQAYDIFFGPVYLTGLAGELGVAVSWVAVLASLPWIGQVGQILGIGVFDHVPSLKKYTVTLATLARTLWLIPLAAAAYWGALEYFQAKPFPVLRWFTILTFTACTVAILANSAGVSWHSWMRALIPDEGRGRFFGVKQRYGFVAAICANLVAAAWVGWKPQGYRLGYGVICFLAVTCAFLSSFLLSKVPDARKTAAIEPPGERRPFLTLIGEPLRDASFRKVLFFAASFNAAMLVASPYFSYYFTRDLKISMGSVAIWSMLSNLGCVLSAPLWGRRIDQTAGPKSTLWWAAHLLAISPLAYLVGSATWVRAVAPFEYFISGVTWSGYTLGVTTLLFSACPAEKSARYFSVYLATVGLGGAIGAFLGGHIAEALMSLGGFRALWVVATCVRLSVLWIFYRTLFATRPQPQLLEPVVTA